MRHICSRQFDATNLLDLDPRNPAAYVQLANSYAGKKKWESVSRVRKAMRENGQLKHQDAAGSRSRTWFMSSDQGIGFIPSWGSYTRNLTEEQKQQTLKVLREAASGSRDADRVKLKLEIKVEAVEYDKEGSVLRIRGKNILENEHVKIGAFHTLELDLHRPFVLRKEFWDSMALDVLQQASDPKASADLAVVLMQEGLANVLLIGKSMTSSRARIEASIPRKHGPAIAGYDKAMNKFFENVLQAFLKNVNFDIVRCAVIASPGFTKDQFYKHLLLEAERRQLRSIIENKSRIILVHTTSGYKHSLREVLETPNVMSMIKNTKAAQEVRVLEDFFGMLSNDPERACYGPKHVEVAHERMAIQTLLITDELFRSADIPARKKYVNLVDSVKATGGTVHVFSSMHVSGEQLAQLTGIAAILRFPLPDLDDIEM